jgi:release factor glutamine methyltransferase
MAMTIREAFMKASSFLQQSHTEELGQDPQRVARWLLEALLACTNGQLLLRFDDDFPGNKMSLFDEMLQRKAAGEPVQYIVGEAAFMELNLRVTPDVLIPRPETELLVEAIALAAGKRWTREAPLRVVDVGTGSGTIPVTLAVHQAAWTFTAVDLSEAALAVARGNAEKYDVADRVRFVHGDLLEPVLDEGAVFDILVSNPPYIPTSKLAGLQREVQCEPMLALDGGDDGLVLYRKMVQQVASMAVKPSLIGFELGIGQAEVVATMIREGLGWTDVQIITDLQGIGRHVIAQAPLME